MDTTILVINPAAFPWSFTSVRRQGDVCVSRLEFAAAPSGVRMISVRSARTNLDWFQKPARRRMKCSFQGDEGQHAPDQSTGALLLAVCCLTVGLEASLPREAVQSPSLELFKTQQE